MLFDALVTYPDCMLPLFDKALILCQNDIATKAKGIGAECLVSCLCNFYINSSLYEFNTLLEMIQGHLMLIWYRQVAFIELALFKLQTTKTNIHARICSLPVCPELSRVNLPKTCDVGKFLSITGTVIRTTTIKMLEYERDFMCSQCKNIFSVQVMLWRAIVPRQGKLWFHSNRPSVSLRLTE